jgi:serine protease inhibitor
MRFVICLAIFCFSVSLALGQVGSQPPAKVNAAAMQDDVKELVKGNNAFAFDLYRQMAQQEKGNFIFSPYSISIALAMVYAGARGETAREMAKVLHFTLPQERLHPSLGELFRTIQGADKKQNYELEIANGLWGAKGLSLDHKFLRVTQTHYQAGFQFVDFAKDAEGARQRINGWVEEQSKKKITELIQKGVIGPNTRMILANAIYLKAAVS